MSEQATVNSEQVPDEAEGFSEKEKAANRPGTEKRDWVGEAVKCFIKDVKDLDPTDPVKAVEAYFEKNATDELKARCKAEGKDAKGCWRFIEAVARKALGAGRDAFRESEGEGAREEGSREEGGREEEADVAGAAGIFLQPAGDACGSAGNGT